MLVKNSGMIDKMRIAGHALAQVMAEISESVVAGISTLDLDTLIEKQIIARGLKPVCKGYAGYRHATCISVNDVIVHGVPSREIVLKCGDFVKIDVIAAYKMYCADLTRYFFVGRSREVVYKLAAVAQNALDSAIEVAVPGNRVSDISACIQKIVEKEGFSIIRSFSGHGIGKDLHEDPDIPNFGKPGKGMLLQEGMTLAIEPMIAEHGHEVVIMGDGWTAKTADGGIAAHVEDTIVVRRGGAEILTRMRPI
jgi:methionyl aminopeptidase